LATESSDGLLRNTKQLGRSFRGTYPTLTPTSRLCSVIDPLSGLLLKELFPPPMHQYSRPRFRRRPYLQHRSSPTPVPRRIQPLRFQLQVTVARNVQDVKLASQTRMKAVNRILRSLELPFKCRIQANRSCGLTTARSHSTAKKLRNCGSKPKCNPLNHRKRARGNVQSNSPPLLLWTFSARLSYVDLHADHRPCFPPHSVFLSNAITSLTTPLRATSSTP